MKVSSLDIKIAFLRLLGLYRFLVCMDKIVRLFDFISMRALFAFFVTVHMIVVVMMVMIVWYMRDVHSVRWV